MTTLQIRRTHEYESSATVKGERYQQFVIGPIFSLSLAFYLHTLGNLRVRPVAGNGRSGDGDAGPSLVSV